MRGAPAVIRAQGCIGGMADNPNLIGLAVCIHRIGFVRNFRSIADLIGPQSTAYGLSHRTGHNVLAVCGYGGGNPLSSPALSTLITFPAVAKFKKEDGAGLLCASHAGGQDCYPRNSGILRSESMEPEKPSAVKAEGGVAAPAQSRPCRPWYFPARPGFEKRPNSLRCRCADRLKINGFAHGPE